MNLSLTIAIYLREVRSWRHRFWWLPLVGTWAALLPLVLTPTTKPDEGRRRFAFARENLLVDDSDTSFLLNLPVPQHALTLTVCIACGLTALLAAWLARELRAAEVRNATLTDVAVTMVRPLELAVGQIAAAWTIAVMPLIGAAPVIVPFAVRIGRNATDVLSGLAVLLGAALLSACVGYAGFWWKRLVLVASRGRSFRLWMMGVAAIALVAGWGLASSATYPLWRWVRKGLPLHWREDSSYLNDILLTNFIVGVWMLALLWLLACLARGLWRRRWKGRATLALLIAFIAFGATHAKPGAWLKRFLSAAQPMNFRSALDWYLIRPDATLKDVPMFPAVVAAQALGGNWDFNSGEGRRRDDAAQQHLAELCGKMILVGGAFWLSLALAAFLFALGDVGWVLRQPWLVEVLRRPEAAPLMIEFGGDAARRRQGVYVFESRNPIYDYSLARSGGSRAVMIAWFALIIVGMTVTIFLGWKNFVKEQPESGAFAHVLPRTWDCVALLCWMCGMHCGLTIAHMKTSLQWWSLQSLPFPFRSVLWGICLPRLVDALFIIGAAFSLAVVGMTLHSFSFSFEPMESVDAWQFSRQDIGLGGIAYFMAQPSGYVLHPVLNMLRLTFVGVATSLFAASRSRGAAKTTVLAVILSALITKVIPLGYDKLLDWHRTKWYRFQTWGVETPPPPLMREPWGTIGSYMPYVAAALGSLILLGLAVRRLKRET
jgi:hypothetical protein